MQKQTLEQYNLTEENYKKYKNTKSLTREIYLKSLLIHVMIFFLLWLVSKDIMMAIAVTLFIMIISTISIFIYVEFNSNYRNILRYENHLNEYNDWWYRTQENYWKSMTGERFEQELADIYKKLGCKVSLTPTTDDKGIDIDLKKEGKRIIVQCKAHKNPISPHVVRELYGTLVDSGADEGILASVSGFTRGTREFIFDKPITLIDLNDIIEMHKQITGDSREEAKKLI